MTWSLFNDHAHRALEFEHAADGLRRIIATMAPGNLASQRLLAKAGMTMARERLSDDGTKTCVFKGMARPFAYLSARLVRTLIVSDGAVRKGHQPIALGRQREYAAFGCGR